LAYFEPIWFLKGDKSHFLTIPACVTLMPEIKEALISLFPKKEKGCRAVKNPSNIHDYARK
jgi:hypothetical protein